MQYQQSRNGVNHSTVTGPLVQAGSIGQVSIHQGPPSAALPPAFAADAWARAAHSSGVWDHVAPERDPGGEYRLRTARTAAALAALRDRAAGPLAADPWKDPGIGERFLVRLDWLLGEPRAGHPLDLWPAEAALLVLTPFLYQVHALRRAERYAGVRPGSLRPDPAADGERASFESFADGYGVLVERALLRGESEAPIGWWLFHRWLDRRGDFADPAALHALVRDLLDGTADGADAPDPVSDEADRALAAALDPGRLSSLLHGLRRGPDVCNPDHLGGLPPDDRLPGPGRQRIRVQRLGLLLALAYGTCTELTTLPDVVVEHLGIPYAVDLEQLRATVDRSDWGGSPDLPVLRAECRHEAVIEGLRACTARVDELLHAVNRTVRERITVPMPPLPTRLSADGVVPAEGVFTGWAAFRLDESRVRGLLMGVQLYKDRDLALRELYQNALDACRYRRARTEYLDRTNGAGARYAYTGAIDIEQAVDADGRAYVECRDNGIGMGESELRGVFSHAGARFAEQVDFLLERTAWNRLDPPVTLHPNSRFGIGVLSYFMLADEIRVTTCRMGPSGEPGPLLEVAIFGPGHLFRITELAPRGTEPGTTVRLYLQARPDGPDRSGRSAPGSWSCVDGLERVLGIAEFATTAAHPEADRSARWEAGVLRPRTRPDGERSGLDVRGTLVPWPDAPPGAQVVWCERGGALLVDGLLVEPSARRGALSSSDAGLTGAVVNLSGPLSPGHLSADRGQVLDDVSDVVTDLLDGAATALAAADEPLPTFEWICQILPAAPDLADRLTRAVIDADRSFTVNGITFEANRTGCLPADVSLASPGRFAWQPYGKDADRVPDHSPLGSPPDHVYLWRLLAQAPNADLTAFTEICPELADVQDTLPALPSDQLALTHQNDNRSSSFWNGPEPGQEAGDFRGAGKGPVSATELLRGTAAGAGVRVRAERLRAAGRTVPDEVLALALAAEREPLLFCFGDTSSAYARWLEPGGTVPAGHLARASRLLGISVEQVHARLLSHGLRPAPGQLSGFPDEETVILLSCDLDGEAPWLDIAHPVGPAHVLQAANDLGLGIPTVLDRLTALGYTPASPFPADATIDDLPLMSTEDGPLDPGERITYGPLLDALREGPLSLAEGIDRLREYGFDIPLTIPGVLTPQDEELLTPFNGIDWWGMTAGEVVPFATLLPAAQALHTSPRELAARLSAYGLRFSCRDLPPGLTFLEASDLLNVTSREHAPLKEVTSLHTLTEKAHHLGTSLQQTAAWLRALGVTVPDLHASLLKALSHVPRKP